MAEISRYHRVYIYPNGAILIYYKQNVNNTTQANIGFICGSQKDGDIPGLAHFTEHILYKQCKEFSEVNVHKINRATDTNANAFTTRDVIMLEIDCPNRNLDTILFMNSKLLFNKEFTQEEIDNERPAIEEEINMYADETQNDDILGVVQDSVCKTIVSASKIVGTKKSIAKIRPENITKFVNNNFVSENLVMSVVSNLEFEEIKEKMEKYFVNNAVSDKSKINRPIKDKYSFQSDYMFTTPDKDTKTVEVTISFKCTKCERENNLYTLIEDYLFNGFSGKLLAKLRTENGLVYTSNFEHTPLIGGNLSLKTFVALTSKRKVNKVIECICKIAKDLKDNGITLSELNSFKNMILSREDRRMGLKTISPTALLSRYIRGDEIFFNNQIHKIPELTLKDVNDYLKQVYGNSNIVVSVAGDFDEKKLYDIKDIEEMLGLPVATQISSLGKEEQKSEIIIPMSMEEMLKRVENAEVEKYIDEENDKENYETYDATIDDLLDASENNDELNQILGNDAELQK